MKEMIYDRPLGIFYPTGFRSNGRVRKFMTREFRLVRRLDRWAGVVRTRGHRYESRSAVFRRMAYCTVAMRPINAMYDLEEGGKALRTARAAACKLAGLHRACQRRGVRPVAPLSDLPPFRSWA